MSKQITLFKEEGKVMTSEEIDYTKIKRLKESIKRHKSISLSRIKRNRKRKNET